MVMLRFSCLSVHMAFPADVFRSNDIRGLLEQITPELAKAAGAVLVRMTGAKTVVVGRDMRATSPELAVAAIEGITMMGANVVDIGRCTTSMYNFAVSSQPHIDAGLMVTASHNPAAYNGIKFARANGMPIPGTEFLSAVEEAVTPAAARGTVEHVDILTMYLDACVLADMPDVRGTKLVIDFGNGMGALSVLPLCERLGVEVVSMYAEPDPSFPNHEANPAKEETLADVKAAVVREGADFGVAIDGDADRIAFIDNEGRSLRGDQTLVLLAKDVLATQPGATFITAPNMSWATADLIAAASGKTVECPVGRTKVIKAMHETGAAIGGEISSHFMFADFRNLEAVDHVLVRVLSLWKRSGKPMAELASDVRAWPNSGEINMEVHDKAGAIARVKAAYVDKATTVNTLDGIRCEFGRDWWFLVRASNTEPILRLIVEAKDEVTMLAKREELLSLINES